MGEVKGFKVFNPDWTCRGFQYEVGKVYKENVKPSVCGRGFHFCKQAKSCFDYYSFDPENKVAEVIALGEVAEKGDKCCTNKIKIVREITWQELLTLVNTGKGNSGLCNSGDCNSGLHNSGDCNSGDFNTGNRNSGHKNSGDWNSGDFNTGNRNTGDCNTGDCNTGNRNTGDCNSGDFNTGDFNTGDYNKASYTVGCFNTQSQKLRFFDKETDITFEEWRNSEAYRLMNRIDFRPADWIWENEMSDAEKAEHPEYKTTGGYLKVCDTDKAFLTWWDALNEVEKQVIKNIPNFDADKFFIITGIRVE